MHSICPIAVSHLLHSKASNEGETTAGATDTAEISRRQKTRLFNSPPEELRSESILSENFFMLMLLVFAGLRWFGSVGIRGHVLCRSHEHNEIGIRMALGAQARMY